MKVKLLFSWILGVALTGLVATGAQANLIVNGGFEDNDVATGTWAYYSSSAVNGWQGSNIEIWDTMSGVVAPEGTQHAELNAHPYMGSLFSIYQTFATVVGQEYDVSFFYSARSSSDEAFNFSVGDLNLLFNDHVAGTWNQYMGTFVAQNTTTELRFTSTNTSTYGNFLDDVFVDFHLPNVRAVVEPNSAWLMLLGFVGLLVVRVRSGKTQA